MFAVDQKASGLANNTLVSPTAFSGDLVFLFFLIFFGTGSSSLDSLLLLLRCAFPAMAFLVICTCRTNDMILAQ